MSLERIIAFSALLISILSAAFSYFQANTSAQQFLLTSQQLRPHITYTPTFFSIKDGLQIDMYLQNHAPLPANVIYTDVAASLDGIVFDQSYNSIEPDIIHQGRDGVSTPPLISGKPFFKIKSGESILLIATCAIYGSTSEVDSRRWIIRAISEYIPGYSLPSRRSIEEQETSIAEKQCDAKKSLISALKSKQ